MAETYPQEETRKGPLKSLRARPVQAGALFVAVALASMLAPATMPDSYRLGSGAAIVVVAAVLAAFVLIWRKEARGFIPMLTLLLSVPLATLVHVGTSAGENSSSLGSDYSTDATTNGYIPNSADGDWVAEGQIRSYWFSLSEAANGDLTGTVEFTQPDGPMERFPVTGSRLGGGVLIRFEQTDHTPWIINGQFLNDKTIRAYLSVGPMVLGRLTLTRERG